jgi:hypothetical protein
MTVDLAEIKALLEAGIRQHDARYAMVADRCGCDWCRRAQQQIAAIEQQQESRSPDGDGRQLPSARVREDSGQSPGHHTDDKGLRASRRAESRVGNPVAGSNPADSHSQLLDLAGGMRTIRQHVPPDQTVIAGNVLRDVFDGWIETLERLATQDAGLREALAQLRNEVAGVLGIAGRELREAIGNTNMKVLLMRLDEADAALLAARPSGGEGINHERTE